MSEPKPQAISQTPTGKRRARIAAGRNRFVSCRGPLPGRFPFYTEGMDSLPPLDQETVDGIIARFRVFVEGDVDFGLISHLSGIKEWAELSGGRAFDEVIKPGKHRPSHSCKSGEVMS